MADLKISQLTDGGASQAADEYVIARSGANYRIDGASVAAAATSVGTLTSLTVSGAITGATSTNTINGLVINSGGLGGATGIKFGIGAAFSSGQAEAYTTSTTPMGIGTVGAQPLRFYTNSALVAAFDSSGNLAVDTNTLYVDAANNRVGVGTASPEAQFVVSTSTAGGEGGYIYIDNPAVSTLGNKAGIKFATSGGGSFASVPTGEITNVVTDAGNGASAITFGTYNGSASGERMRLDASGNLGLGVTPSAGGATANYRLFEIGLDGGGSIYSGTNQTLIGTNINWDGGTPKYKKASAAPALYDQQNGAHKWSSAAGGSVGGTISFGDPKMTLDASGNLGIGFASPTTPIDVKSGSVDGVSVRIRENASGNALIQITDNPVTTARLALSWTNSTTSANLSTTGLLSFSTNGSERARIHASGGFSVGTTTDPGAGVFLANTAVSAPRLSTTTAGSFGTALSTTGYQIYADATYGAAIAGYGTTSDVTILGRAGNVLLTGTDNGGVKLGFYGTNPQAKPTITGSRGANAALASLLTALANLGLLTDSTT